MVEPSQLALAPDREAVLRELIGTFEQRSSSSTADLFQVANKDLSATKKLFYGGGSVIVLIMSTVGGWVMDAIEKQQKLVDVIEAQSRQLDELVTRSKLDAARQQQIARRVVANEVLIVDGIEWVAGKIDAKGRSRSKQKPRSLKAAKRRIDDAGAGMGQLFRLDSLSN